MTSIFRPALATFVFALWSLALFSPAQAMETTAKHAILIDATTGTILMEKDADNTEMETEGQRKIRRMV